MQKLQWCFPFQTHPYWFSQPQFPPIPSPSSPPSRRKAAGTPPGRATQPWTACPWYKCCPSRRRARRRGDLGLRRRQCGHRVCETGHGGRRRLGGGGMRGDGARRGGGARGGRGRGRRRRHGARGGFGGWRGFPSAAEARW